MKLVITYTEQSNCYVVMKDFLNVENVMWVEIFISQALTQVFE